MRTLLAALIAVGIATPALGAPAACNTREAVKKHLAGKYQEKSAELGIANNGGVVELFTAKNGKTWTLVITLPNGPTCLLAAGNDWEKLPKVLYGKHL